MSPQLKNAGHRKLSPLELSLSQNAEGFFLFSASDLFRYPLPPPCLFCKFVSRLPEPNGDQGRSPAVFLVLALCAEQELLSKRAAFLQGGSQGLVQTQSGFKKIILKNFCQILSVRGEKYTKSEVLLDQPLKNINLNEAGMFCISLIFYI